jgi:hypothetical protein
MYSFLNVMVTAVAATIIVQTFSKYKFFTSSFIFIYLLYLLFPEAEKMRTLVYSSDAWRILNGIIREGEGTARIGKGFKF